MSASIITTEIDHVTNLLIAQALRFITAFWLLLVLVDCVYENGRRYNEVQKQLRIRFNYKVCQIIVLFFFIA